VSAHANLFDIVEHDQHAVRERVERRHHLGLQRGGLISTEKIGPLQIATRWMAWEDANQITGILIRSSSEIRETGLIECMEGRQTIHWTHTLTHARTGLMLK
jgi:hypothetical protein